MENEERMRKLDEETFEAISIMINRPDFVRQKDFYKEGDKVNMCKAMEDWKEELLQEGFERGIKAIVLDYLEEGLSEERIIEKLQKIFQLDREAAQSFLEIRNPESRQHPSQEKFC